MSSLRYSKVKWGVIGSSEVYKIEVDFPSSDLHVELTNYGAALLKIVLPDRYDHKNNIICGSKSLDEHIRNSSACMGSTVGRVANRIGNGEFILNGKKYKLEKNDNNKHCLHGGSNGFHRKLWSFEGIKDNKDKLRVKFFYMSPDGEENFPSNLKITVEYVIKPMSVGWRFSAETDKPTIVNITNHAYWNLDSHLPEIYDSFLKLNSDYYLPTDETKLPIKRKKEVQSLGLIPNQYINLKEFISANGDIDNPFLLTKSITNNSFDFAAKLKSEISGRSMEIWTTEPCLQVYTGNYMENLTSFGLSCLKHSAICLETQKVPNAINFPGFTNSVILNPNEKFSSETEHRFYISR